MDCPTDADNSFGPRITTSCRPFDFTLLFEDAIFWCLPAVALILCSVSRWRVLYNPPNRLVPRTLAWSKLLVLAVLLALKAIFVAFRTRQMKLRTSFLAPAGGLDIVATFMTILLTHLEDEKSFAPSTVLVLYYSASTLCFLPMLRTTWLLENNAVCSLIWTFIWLLTLLALVLESSTQRSSTAQIDRDVTKEQLESFWGRNFFIYLLPFLRYGYCNTIGISDVPAVDKPLRSKEAYEQLLPVLHRYEGRFRLLRSILSAFKWSLASAIIPRLSLAGLSFCQAFLMPATLRLVKDQEENDMRSYKGGIIGAYVFVYFGIAASRSIYRRQAYRFVTTTRACLVYLVYDHTLVADDGHDSDRRAITAMGTDVEQAIKGLGDIHEIWACTIEMAFAIWLLTKQVAAASAVPVVICIISLLTCGLLSKGLGPAIAAWNGKVQIRLSATSRMLSAMKAVKLQGLGDVLYNRITRLRMEELETSELFRRLIVGEISISNIPVDFAPFATFTIYAISAGRSQTGQLSIEQAFTSLALITLLTAPLLNFCQAFPSLVEAIACLGRVEEYCSSDLYPADNTELDMGAPALSVVEMSVLKHGCQGTTQSVGPTSPNPSIILSSQNLSIEEGITAIIGPTGSGKSTLLKEILRGQAHENNHESGEPPKIAYCKQDPWIMSKTIRENIVGDLDFDKDWFGMALSLCELETDLAALEARDLHCAGDRGMSLSGGQRQRIALARAVYSRIKIVVLDDPFSGPDPQIMSAILGNLLGVSGWFRRTKTSVVLATHDLSFAAYADTVVSVSDGVVLSQRSNSSIPVQPLDRISDSQVTPGIVNSCPSLAPNALAVVSAAALTPPRDSVVSTNRSPVPERSWSPYKYYFAAISWPWLSLLIVATLVEALASNSGAFWLEHWASQDGSRSSDGLGPFVGVYALICLLSLSGTAIGCWVFFVLVINKSSARLHSDLLKVTIGAAFSSFQEQAKGSILNRFGQDIELVDMTLPTHGITFLTGFCSCAVKLIILCVLGRYLSISVPVISVMLYYIQAYYLQTSRQIRLLSIETRAPLYSHFLETADGASTIRGFGWQTAFRKAHETALDNSQKPFYMLLSIQQWLTLMLDLLVWVVAVALVATTILLKGHGSAGSLGVALNIVLTFNSSLTGTIQSWTKLETSIGAVSRLQAFVEGTPQESSRENVVLFHHDWPTRGCVSFRNVTAGYNTSTQMVLQDVSLDIAPGEKVAICGSSGSGKSTLIMALLQLISLTNGQMTIDGIDLSKVEVETVRNAMNVISQDLVSFAGTLRSNLDPHGEASDGSIISGLKQVGLWDRFALSGGLDTEMNESLLSIGEFQLISLARALIRERKIVVLDEAFSSLDEATEDAVQKVLERVFEAQTVISVTHHFRHILWFDRVVVMNQGKVEEIGSPGELLGRPSAFRALYLSERTSTA